MPPRPAAIALLLLQGLLAAPAGAQAPAAAGASLRGLSVAPDGAVWASGTGGTVIRSLDGGRSWSARSISDAAGLDLRDVAAVSASTAYAMVAGADTARIYRTDDGGRHWTRQYDDTRKGVFLDGLAFWDAARGIALGDPMGGRFLILRTEDGGAHWTELPKDAAPQALPGEAAFAASGTAVVAGPEGRAWIAPGGGAVARVLRSTDYGRSWTASDTPIPAGASAGIFSLAFRDARDGIAAGGDYAHPRAARANVARTTDGGRTWTLGDSAGVTAYLSAATWLPGSTMIVAVGTEGAFESADGGRTWVRRDTVSWNAVSALRRRGWVVAVGEGGRAGVWAAPMGRPRLR